MRRVSTRVFPEPAPARMHSGSASVATASRCEGLRPSNSRSWAMPRPYPRGVTARWMVAAGRGRGTTPSSLRAFAFQVSSGPHPPCRPARSRPGERPDVAPSRRAPEPTGAGALAWCAQRPPRVKGFLSYPVDILDIVLLGLDLDGVVCDLGPCVAARIAARFGVSTHPATWRTYDLRELRLGVPEAAFAAFLEEAFSDPALYEQASAHDGAVVGVSQLLLAR